jgi:DNA repair protein RadC
MKMKNQLGLFTVPHVKAVCVRESEVTDSICDTPEKVVQAWRETVEADPIFDAEKEHFVVFFMDTKHRVKGFNIVSIGNLTSALAHPREVFRPAIATASSALIVAHNHPSGDSSPSSADLIATRNLLDAGKIIGINILDHVIIGVKERCPRELGYYSFREAGII